MSTRETVLATVTQTLIDAAISGVKVVRNLDIETSERQMGADVKTLINVVDGDPGEADVMLSPVSYHYDHVAELEVLTVETTEGQINAEHDTVLVAISTALNVDTTLGGVLTSPFLLLDQPEELESLDVGGSTPAKGSVVPVTLPYDTPNPLE